jgi:hypothetical protein
VEGAVTDENLTPMQKAARAHGHLLDFRQRLRDVLAGVMEFPSDDDIHRLAVDWRAAQVPFEAAWAALVELPAAGAAKVLVGVDGRPLLDTTTAENLAREVGRISKLRNELAIEWVDVLNAGTLRRRGERERAAEAAAGPVVQQKIRDLEQTVRDLEEDNAFLRQQRDGQRQTRSAMTSA